MTTNEMLLVTLMEECDELSQRCSKALRFGIFETQPGQELNNSERIQHEYADLMATYDMLVSRNRLTVPHLEQVQSKEKKLFKYLEYSKQQGTLKD